MISTFTAFFDANIFYSVMRTSPVIYLARTKLFRAPWRERVHDEWTDAVARKRGIDPGKLAVLRYDINAAIPDCIVSGFEDIEQGLDLPDPDDRHVLAAAITGGADLVVTCNLKHFPADKLAPFGMEALHPDQFLANQLDLAPDLFVAAVKDDIAHYENPKPDLNTYVGWLRRAELADTANLIENLRVVIDP